LLNGNGKVIGEIGIASRPPSLDEIRRDPARVLDLSPGTIAQLMSDCGAVEGALKAAAAMRPNPPARTASVDQSADWLDADRSAALLHKPRRWLFQNSERLPFVRRLSKKSLVCSEAGLHRWLASRKP